MQSLNRRQALAAGAGLVAGMALKDQRTVAAQETPKPTFLMFHVEAGW